MNQFRLTSHIAYATQFDISLFEIEFWQKFRVPFHCYVELWISEFSLWNSSSRFFNDSFLGELYSVMVANKAASTSLMKLKQNQNLKREQLKPTTTIPIHGRVKTKWVEMAGPKLFQNCLKFILGMFQFFQNCIRYRNVRYVCWFSLSFVFNFVAVWEPLNITQRWRHVS